MTVATLEHEPKCANATTDSIALHMIVRKLHYGWRAEVRFFEQCTECEAVLWYGSERMAWGDVLRHVRWEIVPWLATWQGRLVRASEDSAGADAES